jgi:hypothetical protein
MSLSGCSGGHTQAFEDICNYPDFQSYISNASSALTLELVESDKETYKTNFREWELESYQWADGLASLGAEVTKKIDGLSSEEKDLKDAVVAYSKTANEVRDKLVPYLQDTSSNYSADWYIAMIPLSAEALSISVACLPGDN